MLFFIINWKNIIINWAIDASMHQILNLDFGSIGFKEPIYVVSEQLQSNENQDYLNAYNYLINKKFIIKIQKLINKYSNLK